MVTFPYNQTYLVPDLEPLAESFTVIYYDQRGSGRFTLVSEPEALTVDSHLADLESDRQYFGLDRMMLFGHSWDALLAANFSLGYFDHLSAIVLSSPSTSRQNPYSEKFLPNGFDAESLPITATAQSVYL